MKFSNIDIPVREENNPTIEPSFANSQKLSEGVPCRDPFIMLYNNRYYLYKTLDDVGIGCQVSDDLETWSEPVTVFETPQNFHGIKDMYWAPECHYYNGNFYIFTSVFFSKYNHRVISVYRSKNPLGPFDMITDCVSPSDWDSIDGTLYVDEEGCPWMVFVHEWTCMPGGNGGMAAAKLSEDFTELTTEPLQLFLSNDPSWADWCVTDGPYMIKGDSGTLYMIWSNFIADNSYAVGLAKSDNGKIDGNWSHFDEVVYAENLREEFKLDGGHAMIFRTKEGKDMITFHTPNSRRKGVEHVGIMPIIEKDGALVIE